MVIFAGTYNAFCNFGKKLVPVLFASYGGVCADNRTIDEGGILCGIQRKNVTAQYPVEL
jgi:hypothetical protein